MNLPILLADVNATTVLSVIHWVGVGFIFLWFLGSCMKDGLWDNALRCFNAYMALFLSLPLTVLAAGLIGDAVNGSGAPDPHMDAAIAIGANWVGFLVCLLVLQTITERLSRVKLAFHPVVGSIGSFVFVCGITAVLSSYSWPIYEIVRQTK